jgi:hypothetical protein
MNLPRFLAVTALAAGITISAAACGGRNSGGATSQASAIAASDSAQAHAAESAAAQVAGKCLPPGTSTDLWVVELLAKSSARQAFAACEKIPPGDGDKVAACVLTAAQAYHASSAGKAARQAAFITSAGTCVNSLGASPSGSPSAASVAPATASST